MKNKIFLTLLATSLMITACEKPFELSTDGRLTYEQIFGDYKLTGNYLSKAYTFIPGLGASSAGGNFLGVFTDEAHDAQDVVGCAALNYNEGRMSSSSNPIDGTMYNELYAGIRMCNVFIDHIDNVPMTIQENRSKWRGEAHILRAFYYLQLIKRYGPMPIIKHELPMNFDYSTITRPTFYENVQEIIKDCNLALEEPNLPWRIVGDGENGSMTKSVAYAIKSQAILYAASPLWNNGKDHWAEAATITLDALTSLQGKGFLLFNPANSTIKAHSNYQRYFLIKPELAANPANDKETIYAQKGQIGTIWQQHGVPIIADVSKAGANPTQELVDAYETINGLTVLDLKNPYNDAEHLSPNYNTENKQYNPTNPYQNRDPRLFSTVFCNGNFYNLNNNTQPVFTYSGGNCGISETSNLYTRTGYYIRKWANFTSTKSANGDGYWRHFRLAELYLNYAEAEFYANGVTQAAIDAVDAVRVRAKMPKLPTNISAEDFELRLRNERRVEFAFEEHRYYDVRRWKIQGSVDGVVTGMKITKESDSPLTYKYDRFVVRKRLVTDSKYLMWPIPQAEALRYDMIGVKFQNPGW